eukprot:TRINITY_DN9697_c0_g3_i1.p1 TRINITY_DN9697_c0_g3~~TRINITY_DN9697_c0_g3_i1.p1  ORF type:complete len:503 (+),score=182.75 TRINITY_DN9697_c0_g3_i1:137-1510(+)
MPVRDAPRTLPLRWAGLSVACLVGMAVFTAAGAAPPPAAPRPAGQGRVVSVPLRRRVAGNGTRGEELIRLRDVGGGLMGFDARQMDAAFGSAAAAPVGVELSLQSWEDWLAGLWGSPADDGRRVRGRSLHNAGNIEYLARVDIGTPPQAFELIADTGSSNTWVAGRMCTVVGCARMATFDPTASTTFRALPSAGSRADGRFQLTYGTGACEGVLASDVVGIGGVSTPLSIGVATSVAPFFEKVPYADGILGLGLRSLSDGDLPTLLDGLQERRNISRRVLSMYLASEGDAVPSQMSFGGPDPTLYAGELRYVPFVPLHGRYLYYVVEFDGFWVDGAPLRMGCRGRCLAVVDTGTSLLLGPPRDIDHLVGALGISALGCRADRVLQVGVGGVLYTIPPEVFLMDGYDCTPALQPDTMMPGVFIFGDPFFRAVYTVFDNEDNKLGVAAHKNMPPAVPIP